MAHAVTSSDRSQSTIHTESLRPPQIRSRYKRIIPFLTKIPFIPLLNLYQTVHWNLSAFSTSRFPSMMVSIIEIVLYTKPTAEHQYRVLRSSCHPLHTYSLRIRRICSFHDTTYSYYHLHSHKRLNHTYPSSCRIPPSYSLNVIYFSQAHLHSFILPTWCYFV